MKRPKKINIDWGKDSGWSKEELVGYNQAIEDMNTYLPSEEELRDTLFVARNKFNEKAKFDKFFEPTYDYLAKAISKRIRE